MGYYIRVLGTNTNPIALETLRAEAAPAVLDLEDDAEGDWKQLTLKHASGVEIAILERNLVVDGELGAEELAEFQDEVGEYQPQSAAEWLKAYLPKVAVIYALQLLDGTDVEDGWSALHRVHGELWKAAGGILQSDGEGFSNESGHTILWQFSDRASGNWNCGVLDGNGEWINFEMDLGDVEQREQFRRGELPSKASVL